MKNKKQSCTYTPYGDYFETDCGEGYEVEDYDNIEPTYCPFCGRQINAI